MQQDFIDKIWLIPEDSDIIETSEYNELQDIMKSEKSKAESFLGEIYFAANFELKGNSWYE